MRTAFEDSRHSGRMRQDGKVSAAGHDLAHKQCLTGIQGHIRSKQNSVPRDNGCPLPQSQLFQQASNIFCSGTGKLEFGAAGLELNGDSAAAPLIALA